MHCYLFIKQITLLFSHQTSKFTMHLSYVLHGELQRAKTSSSWLKIDNVLLTFLLWCLEMRNLDVFYIKLLEIIALSRSKEFSQVVYFGFSPFVISSKGCTQTRCPGLKKNGIKNLSLSEFTITLCSTLS